MSRRPRPEDEEGFTLVELLVVVALAAVIGTLTTSAIVSAFRSQTKLDGRADAVIQVRQALQRTLRDVRAADPIKGITASQLTLSVNNGSGSQDVTYRVQTTSGVTSLLRTTTAGSGTQIVASHLVNTAAQPVFTVQPVPNYQAPSGVNGATCGMNAYPGYYEPDCVGTITVRLVVVPTTGQSGKSQCPASGAALAACAVDISDDADIRNAA